MTNMTKNNAHNVAQPHHKQIWLEFLDSRKRFCRIRLKRSARLLGYYKNRIMAKGLYWAVIKIRGKYSLLQLVIHPEAYEADIEEGIEKFLEKINGTLVRWYYKD
jgi:hypothetical protein